MQGGNQSEFFGGPGFLEWTNPRLTSRSIEDFLPTGNLANRELRAILLSSGSASGYATRRLPQPPFWPTRPGCGCISVQCLVIEWPPFGPISRFASFWDCYRTRGGSSLSGCDQLVQFPHSVVSSAASLQNTSGTHNIRSQSIHLGLTSMNFPLIVIAHPAPADEVASR
jgi:hypothetical protein